MGQNDDNWGWSWWHGLAIALLSVSSCITAVSHRFAEKRIDALETQVKELRDGKR